MGGLVFPRACLRYGGGTAFQKLLNFPWVNFMTWLSENSISYPTVALSFFLLLAASPAVSNILTNVQLHSHLMVVTVGCLEPPSLCLLICLSSTGEMLAHTLKAFMELMEHDFVSWETLSAAFIKKVSVFCSLHSLCPWDSCCPRHPGSACCR